ncbi:MAG: hypothetical protein Q9183_007464, partial [Haloplaca sp. 2 TL-2023]
MRNRLGILYKRIEIQIRHIIARLMIIPIIRDPSTATKQCHFLLGLDALGARKQASSRNTHILESGIITATVKRISHVVKSRIIGEIILEEFLRFRRPRCACDAEGRSIAIIDAVLVVRGGDHIEVEVEADLGSFGVGEGRDVKFGAEEAEFFGGDPDEADGVIDAVLCELDCDFQETDGAGAVVVDAGAFVDRVGVGGQDEDVVGVSACGLGDDVVS